MRGLPLSHFHASRKAAQNAMNSGATHAQSTRASALISLEPADRAWLHHRIAQRFDAMLEQGFVDEVRRLRARGDLHTELPSMRCVGYRQMWQALDQNPAAPDIANARELGIVATRQLAKRQITWLRAMPQRQVIAADQEGALVQVLHQVRMVLNSR